MFCPLTKLCVSISPAMSTIPAKYHVYSLFTVELCRECFNYDQRREGEGRES